MDEAQAEIKIARRNINNLRYADDTTLMAESEEAWQRPCDCRGGVTGDKGKVRLEKDTYT